MQTNTQRLELVKKVGETLADSFCTCNGAARHRQQHRQRHHDAVIVMTVEGHCGTVERFGYDLHRILPYRHLRTESSKFLGHGGRAVALLDPQAVGTGKTGAVLRSGYGKQNGPQIGTVGNVNGGASIAKALEMFQVDLVALQAVGEETADTNITAEGICAKIREALAKK